MSSIFSSVPLRRPKSTVFPLEHTRYSTTEFGRIFPTCSLDCMPSDYIKGRHTHKVRFLPMLTPPFGNCTIKSRSFFVPYRLVIPKWENFITGYYEKMRDGQIVFDAQPNVLIKGDALINTHISDLFNSEENRRVNLMDYLKIKFSDNPQHLPNFEIAKILAFWKIYFDYFVDENLGHKLLLQDGVRPDFIDVKDPNNLLSDVDVVFTYDEFITLVVAYDSNNKPLSLLDVVTTGGLITPGLSDDSLAAAWRNILTLPNITYVKDYFTSALPWAQKGQPVSLPIFDSATLKVSSSKVSIGGDTGIGTNPVVMRNRPNSDGSTSGLFYAGSDTTAPITLVVEGQTVNVGNINPLTINDLRVAFRLQEWLERNARGGSRYIEQIQSHYGVRPQDYRLQRAEYIAGSSQPIVINEVLQTSSTNDGSPLGTMGGHSVTIGKTRSFRYKCYEHGVFLTLTYVTVKPIYFQGVDRTNTRVNFYDYCFPEFAHLGEQPIRNDELLGDCVNGSETFGFQSRYAEYKHERDTLQGDFCHSSLRSWLLGVRDFSATPQLTTEFITVDPKTESSLNSIFPVIGSPVDPDNPQSPSVDTFDHILVESYNDITMSRPLPKYGVPYM